MYRDAWNSILQSGISHSVRPMEDFGRFETCLRKHIALGCVSALWSLEWWAAQGGLCSDQEC